MQKAFRKIRVTDRDLDSVQTNVAQSLTPLLKSAIVDGALVTDILLASGVNRVSHSLGRIPLGWIIVDRDTAATVFKSVAPNITDSSTISFTASAPITISVWFF